METSPLRVGVIGYGYWGPNLARNLTAHPDTHVVAIADADEGRRQAAANVYPWARVVADASALFAAPEIQAVAIATPLFTHFPLAQAALTAGKHVLVEKPLASSVAESEALAALATERGLTCMVDHTFVYTGAVRLIRELVERGHLGRVLYFDSVRINLGLFQPDFNVVWDLAPHDLSIIDYVLGAPARWVSAIGVSHYGTHENLAYLMIGFDDGLLAHIHCNWAAPVKTRRITIAGTERMLVYDDTNPAERVKIYETTVAVAAQDVETTHRLNVQYRTGDVHIPKLDPAEALRVMVGAFAAACLRGEPSPSAVDTGVRVVRMLAAAQESLSAEGKRVHL